MSFALLLTLTAVLLEQAPGTLAAASGGIVKMMGVGEGRVSIAEGDAPFEYSVTLGSKPESSVWVATKVTSSTGKSTAHLRTKLIVEPSVLIFEPEDWSGDKVPQQKFKLIAPEDYIAEETQLFFVEHVVASTSEKFSMQTVAFEPGNRIEVEVEDNDQAAVAMTSSSFRSVGPMVHGSYAVGLRSEPTSPVAVMISSTGGVDISFQPSTIYFTREQWHKPVQVRFEAQNTSKLSLLAASVVHSSESLDHHYDQSQCHFLPSARFAPFETKREVL